MSIAQFALAERSMADTSPDAPRGKTPPRRLAIARGDRAATPEAR